MNPDSSIHVLLVMKSADAVLITQTLSGSNFKLTFRRVESREDFLCSIREPLPDLVVTDYALADMTSLEVLQHVHSLSPQLPIIIITGDWDQHDALACITAGAFNYIDRRFLDTLPSVVEHALRLHLPGNGKQVSGPHDSL